ncbi:Uncharacterized protein T25D10.4 [Toxocara canis]|nr:Uncharacterized protein T25D10.4 [Toxocara canis]
MDDNFADYRKFCANRMRRLERYKKAKSFCSLEDESSNAQAKAQASGSSIGCSSSSADTAAPLRQQRATIDGTTRTATSATARRFDAAMTPTYSEQHSEYSTTTQKFDLLREKMVSASNLQLALFSWSAMKSFGLRVDISECGCRIESGICHALVFLPR